MMPILKQRTALRRSFARTITTWFVTGSDFLHTFDALCTERLFNNAPIFHDLDLLKVWSEFTFCRFHRETATISKLGRLSTTFAFSHVRLFLSYLRGINYMQMGIIPQHT